MKKYIILLSLILICSISFGQAIIQRSGVGNTVQDARLSAQYNLFVPRYADTTAALASNSEGIDSCGAIIFTYDVMGLWFRSCSGGKSWVMIDPSGIPSTGNSWLISGNAGLFTSPVDPQYIGTKTVQGFGIKTSDVNRLIMPAAGLTLLTLQSDTTLNKPMTYNTSTKEWNYGYWFGGGGGGSTPISSLTAAAANNTIDNLAYTQTWQWNSLIDGFGLNLLSSSADGTGAGQSVLRVRNSGANTNNGVTSAAATILNNKTGTTSTNIGLDVTASGGTNNYAIIVPVSGGSVGIGNSAPSSLLSLGTAGSQLGTLSMAGNTSGTITIQPQAAAGTYNFNLPTTAGTSGYLLTSAGGGASPMTYTDPATFVPAVSIYGEYLTTTFPGASLPTGFAKLDGAATITFNNPSISITGGDGNFNNNYVRNTDTSASNNYDYTWEFTLNTKFTDYTGQGKWFGKITANSVTQWNAYVNFRYGGSSSLARATLSLVSGTGNGTPVDSTGTISMADGNIYRIKFSQRMNLINVKVSRLVAGEEAESVYMNYRQNMAATNVLPNVGLAAFGSLDATSGITVTSFKINYDDILNTDAVVIGTSISQGYMVSSMNNHYIEKAFRGSNKTFVNMGQSGSGWVNALAVLPRAERLNPEYYIIEMGANDQAMSVVDFRGWLQVFYDSIVTSYGKQMILLKSYANPTYDSIFYNFSSQYGLILIDPASVMTASAFRADLIHPNDYGNDIMASFCKAAIPSLFGSQVVNDRYSLQGLGDVVIGNSPANNDALLYSSATGKWANSSLTTSFIQNQAASAQTGNFWITGYGAVNSTFGIGANAIAGAKLLVYENTVNGTGVRLQNDASNASISGLKYSQIIQMGTTGFGVSGWPNALLIENQANGGIVNSSIGATYLWQTGTARTLRMTLNATGLGIAQATPTARLHLAASTTAASSGQIKLAEGSALTTPEDGNINYVANNLNFTEGSTVYTLAKTLTNTATLDFGNTAAGVAADLTITVTGAAVGDAVYVGADNASVSADNITFWGWVSATNTVTVRFNNNNLVSAVDPASGTFRVVVTKY